MHTCDTLAALNISFSERFGLTADTPICMPSPLGHSVGAYHGARLSLFNASPLVLQERWDPDLAVGMIHDFKCVFTAAATPFLTDLVNTKASSVSRNLSSFLVSTLEKMSQDSFHAAQYRSLLYRENVC